MTPEQISLLTVPSDPQIHPDGKRVAFGITNIDVEGDSYQRRIHVHDGQSSVPFTAGPIDAMPRWSPDGTKLAFLRATDPKKPIAQLAVMPAAGGEAEVITKFDLGVEYLAWSPDTRWVCVVAKSWRPDLADLSDDDRGRLPKRITRFPYRFDNRGWLHDRLRQLWLVDATGKEEPRRLTGGDFDEVMPFWHPDGERIAFLTDRHPRQGLEPGEDVFVVTLGGDLAQPVARGGWLAPVYSPSGVLHLIGHPEVDYSRLYQLWEVGEEGAVTSLTPRLDRSLIAGGSAPVLPRWKGGAVYSVLEDSGRVSVVTVSSDGEPKVVLGGDRLVTGFDVSDSGRVVAAVTATDLPGDLVEMVGGQETPLAHERGETIPPRPTEHWRVASEGMEIDVWALLPEGDGPFPVLLNIHGGPATQYGFGFFDEFQVYAGAGYAVVACNPRGSSGRGLEFTRAVRTDGWGTVDVTDVTTALESALDRFPQMDGERIGIMGGSYGGFMTAWTTAHDQRYRSAVVERALISFPSFNGTSDIAPRFGQNYLGTTDLIPSWEKSPISVAEKIRTPTLIVHSEDDYRCPIEQAEQLLIVLWNNGVEAEMLRFPGEGHELSRSGKPRHRVERFQAILDWHARYLQQPSGVASRP